MRWRLSGSGWRVARSIDTLARQLDAVWPDGHGADGTIGDASHQARRSDHNPDEHGVVTAIDSGETIEGQGQALVDALVASRDPRIKYVIHEDRIWRSYPKPGIPAWAPGVYTGSNRHLDHVHLSVSSDPALYDDPRPWTIDLEETMDVPTIDIQRILNEVGFTDWEGKPLTEDDQWGPRTASAFKKMAEAARTTAPHGHEATVTLR